MRTFRVNIYPLLKKYKSLTKYFFRKKPTDTQKSTYNFYTLKAAESTSTSLFFCFETEEDWIVQIQTIDQESFSIVVQSTRPIISWKNTFPLKFLDKCHEKYFSIPFHDETNVIELVTLTFSSSVVDV